ncbi:MAG: hypothetical protein WBO22_01830 [Shewanella indica]
MGISKPSQAWAKHQKDMAVLYSIFPVIKPDSVTLAGVEQTDIVGWNFSL